MFFWFSFVLPVFSAEEGLIESTVYINPLEVSVSAPESVKIGTVFTLEAQISNLGNGRIKDASATIYLSPGLKLVSKNPTQKLGNLPAEGSKRASWRVKAESLENYIILVQANGFDERTNQLISAEGTMVITVYQASLWRNFLNFPKLLWSRLTH